MTANQPELSRYLGIALDHGITFNNWLNRWDADLSGRVAIKRSLISACADLNVDGIVVGLDMENCIDAIFTLLRERGIDAWLGIPDQAVAGRFDNARIQADRFPIATGMIFAKSTGAVGVKFGLSLAPNARWSDALPFLMPYINQAHQLNLSVIVEPYFREVDPAEDRISFLKQLHQISSVKYAKLDIHEPRNWSHHYGIAFQPWLARSQGLGFPEFRRNLGYSLDYGCGGTMVGAAIWGIEGESLLGSAFNAELDRRISLIRELIARS